MINTDARTVKISAVRYGKLLPRWSSGARARPAVVTAPERGVMGTGLRDPGEDLVVASGISAVGAGEMARLMAGSAAD
jgi:hypothetical protein